MGKNLDHAAQKKNFLTVHIMKKLTEPNICGEKWEELGEIGDYVPQTTDNWDWKYYLLYEYFILFTNNLTGVVLQHMVVTYVDIVLKRKGWTKLQWILMFNCDTTTYFLGSRCHNFCWTDNPSTFGT